MSEQIEGIKFILAFALAAEVTLVLVAGMWIGYTVGKDVGRNEAKKSQETQP